MKIQERTREFKEIFEEKSWYGASVLETLRSVSYPFVNLRLHDQSHSIAELVQHMLNWRMFVVEKLNGNEEFDIELNSKFDWPESFHIEDEEVWNNLIIKLINSQEEIVEALSLKSEDWLTQKTPGEQYNNDFLIRGIMYHDIYHLGQIRLINSVIKSF